MDENVIHRPVGISTKISRSGLKSNKPPITTDGRLKTMIVSPVSMAVYAHYRCSNASQLVEIVIFIRITVVQKDVVCPLRSPETKLFAIE